MRMDTSQGETAADWLNQTPEKEITQALYDYADERWAARIASLIIEMRRERPFETTGDLVRAVDRAIPKAVRQKDSGHPARRAFQAVRIAVNDELARAKIAANEIADRITLNLRTLAEHAEHASLFPDTATLVLKAPVDLIDTIAARIAIHQATEAKKAEAAAQAQQAIQQAAEPAAAPAAPAPAPWDADEAATLKLGDVNARLTPIQVTADGLRELGIEPAGRDKRAVLYRESQFAAICEAIAGRAIAAKRAALLPA